MIYTVKNYKYLIVELNDNGDQINKYIHEGKLSRKQKSEIRNEGKLIVEYEPEIEKYNIDEIKLNKYIEKNGEIIVKQVEQLEE